MCSSLTPSNSTSSLELSPEYTTMRECHVLLVDLLGPAIASLGDILFAKGIIPKEIKEELLMNTILPGDKARKVIGCLTSWVKHDPGTYHWFVQILKEQGPWGNLIVGKLNDCYVAKAIMPPESSSTVDVEQRMEITVPSGVSCVQVNIGQEDLSQSESRRAIGGRQSLTLDTPPPTPALQSEQHDEAAGVRGATGQRDILFLVSNTFPHDLRAVPRRSGYRLTMEEHRKLEDQGISSDIHHSDLAIMMVRYGLDRGCAISGVPKAETCNQAKKDIAQVMENSTKEGVVLYYIGPGKNGTGDWCFSDGFVSFREIMEIYAQYFKGCVLTIISDCSHSGAWVREAMKYLDEQGVGPCGHVARQRGVLIKVLASCTANEVPTEFTFSTHSAKNDKNTGTLTWDIEFYGNAINRGQHPSGIDFTQIRCKSGIDQHCTMAPGSTWERWSCNSRLFVVRNEENGCTTWTYIKAHDDDEVIQTLKGELVEENNRKCLTDYGEVLERGHGQNPPEMLGVLLSSHFSVDYNYRPQNVTH